VSAIDPKAEEVLQQSGRAFFGKISASVSHELNNVMAIIGQTAGLLEDLLDVSTDDEPIPRERLENIAGRITEQVTRGTGIVKRFHRFAHSVDDPCVQFEIRPTLENLRGLLQRLADLASVTIETDLDGDTGSITGNPFLLQHAVFTTVQLCLATAPADDTITITAAQRDDQMVIQVEGPGDERIPAQVLGDLMQHAGGSMEILHREGRNHFDLAFPLKVG